MIADSMVENRVFTTRYNILPITSIQSFSGIRGRNNQGCKDVYFVRCIGSNAGYIEEIQNMDHILQERSQRHLGNYLRVKELPQFVDQCSIKRCTECFELWLKEEKKELRLEVTDKNPLLRQVMNQGLCAIEQEFRSCSPQASDTMVRNFLIKVMFWTECVGGFLLGEWNDNCADKFVFTGAVKKQEYLFCYFLTMLGIDVLLLLPEGDLVLDSGLLRWSERMLLERQGPCLIPEPQTKLTSRSRPVSDPRSVSEPRPVSESKPVSVVKPVPASKPTPPINSAPRPTLSLSAIKDDRKHGRNQIQAGKRVELEFEELARLATSVVMITTFDQHGKSTGSGSGVMIGEKGFILTNNHVASGGAAYSVRIEDDELTYQTEEIIKWNSLLDLAILRIDRKLKPIPLYRRNEPLVRGQKVVAIGSPLGLFNSVSNGIISGFREIHDVDMIQFTAPISPGSSGGVLLNMYGEVIGISTAGFDSGQNINLAVDYKSISGFVAGFER